MSTIPKLPELIQCTRPRLANVEEVIRQGSTEASRDANKECAAIESIEQSRLEGRRILETQLADLKARLYFDRLFGRLPREIRLYMMWFIRPTDLKKLVLSGQSTKEIYERNRRSIWRGIEVEQYQEFRWAFGDSKHRSAIQRQTIKDFLVCRYDPYKMPRIVLEACKLVDHGMFTGACNAGFLQDMSAMLDGNARINPQISRQTLLCLVMLTVWRVSYNGLQLTCHPPAGLRYRLNIRPLTVDERIGIIEQHTAVVQVRIRVSLERLVKKIAIIVVRWAEEENVAPAMMGRWTVDWMEEYLGPEKKDPKMEKNQLGQWIGHLVAGLIFDTVFSQLQVSQVQIIAANVFEQLPIWELTLDSEREEAGSTDNS